MPHAVLLRRSAVAVAVLGTLAAALGVWAVPALLRHALAQYAAAHGHRADVGTLAFNPLTLTLTADDVRLVPASGNADLVIRHLLVRLDGRTVVGWGTFLDRVDVDVGVLEPSRQPDGRWDIVSLLPESSPNTAWPVVRVREGRLSIDTVTVHDRATLHDRWPVLHAVTASVTDLDTGQATNHIALAAASDRHEAARADAQVTLNPLAVEADVTLNAVDLSRVAGIAPAVGVRLDGRLTGHGHVAWAASRPSDVSAKEVTLSGSALTALAPAVEGLRLALNGWRVDGLAYDSRGGTLGVRTLTLHGPALTLPNDPKALTAMDARPGTAHDALHWDIGRVTIDAGQVRWEDAGRPTPAVWQADAIDLQVAPPTESGRLLALTGTVGGSGHVSLAGAVSEDLAAVNLTLRAVHMDVTQLAPYIESLVALRIAAGTWAADGTLARDADGWRYRGAFSLDDIRTTDVGRHQDFLGVDHLEADGLEAHYPHLALHVATVAARAPYADVHIAGNGRSNFADLVPSNGTRDASPPVTVDTLTVTEGRLHFADESQSPTFEAGIGDLQGRMTGVSSDPMTRARLAFSGHVDRYAPVSIDGDANLLADPLAADVRLRFENLELTGLSPYAGRFAGYRIRKGKATADLAYHVADHRVDATHHVRLSQFELGSRVEGSPGLGVPLGLVVALLKDRNGDIDLDVPLTGSLDDPNFSLTALTEKVVGNLFRKLVTSPFSLLGGLFGHREDLSHVGFAPGESEPLDSDRERLATLAHALVERPALSLDVPIATAASDAQALARQRYQTRLLEHARALWSGADDAALRARLDTSAADRHAALVALEGPDAAQTDLAGLEATAIAAAAPGADELETLANARAQAVQRLLIDGTGVDPGRVFLVRGPAATSTGDRVELPLALH